MCDRRSKQRLCFISGAGVSHGSFHSVEIKIEMESKAIAMANGGLCENYPLMIVDYVASL
jgi:hypothetical protein